MKQYINYDRARMEFVATKERPQNQKQAIPKIKMRIQRLQATLGIELEEVQKILLRLIEYGQQPRLYENNIEIAHNVSIGYIIKELTYLLNHRNEINVEMGAAFAEEILSSDDEMEKNNFRNFLPWVQNYKLTDYDIPAILNYINHFIHHVNKASRNLMPGHRSPNRSIGDTRDPHTIKKWGGHFETPQSQRIATLSNQFFRHKIDPERRFHNYVEENKSSSIDATIDFSWYPVLSDPYYYNPAPLTPTHPVVVNYMSPQAISYTAYPPGQMPYNIHQTHRYTYVEYIRYRAPSQSEEWATYDSDDNDDDSTSDFSLRDELSSDSETSSYESESDGYDSDYDTSTSDEEWSTDSSEYSEDSSDEEEVVYFIKDEQDNAQTSSVNITAENNDVILPVTKAPEYVESSTIYNIPRTIPSEKEQIYEAILSEIISYTRVNGFLNQYKFYLESSRALRLEKTAIRLLKDETPRPPLELEKSKLVVYKRR